VGGLSVSVSKDVKSSSPLKPHSHWKTLTKEEHGYSILVVLRGQLGRHIIFGGVYVPTEVAVDVVTDTLEVDVADALPELKPTSRDIIIPS
jgi:hypothetical protein